jgi:hypothetical protein
MLVGLFCMLVGEETVRLALRSMLVGLFCLYTRFLLTLAETSGGRAVRTGSTDPDDVRSGGGFQLYG